MPSVLARRDEQPTQSPRTTSPSSPSSVLLSADEFTTTAPSHSPAVDILIFSCSKTAGAGAAAEDGSI
jgi:hypothetical protein